MSNRTCGAIVSSMQETKLHLHFTRQVYKEREIALHIHFVKYFEIYIQEGSRPQNLPRQ